MINEPQQFDSAKQQTTKDREDALLKQDKIDSAKLPKLSFGNRIKIFFKELSGQNTGYAEELTEKYEDRDQIVSQIKEARGLIKEARTKAEQASKSTQDTIISEASQVISINPEYAQAVEQIKQEELAKEHTAIDQFKSGVAGTKFEESWFEEGGIVNDDEEDNEEIKIERAKKEYAGDLGELAEQRRTYRPSLENEYARGDKKINTEASEDKDDDLEIVVDEQPESVQANPTQNEEENPVIDAPLNKPMPIEWKPEEEEESSASTSGIFEDHKTKEWILPKRRTPDKQVDPQIEKMRREASQQIYKLSQKRIQISAEKQRLDINDPKRRECTLKMSELDSKMRKLTLQLRSNNFEASLDMTQPQVEQTPISNEVEDARAGQKIINDITLREVMLGDNLGTANSNQLDEEYKQLTTKLNQLKTEQKTANSSEHLKKLESLNKRFLNFSKNVAETAKIVEEDEMLEMYLQNDDDREENPEEEPNAIEIKKKKELERDLGYVDNKLKTIIGKIKGMEDNQTWLEQTQNLTAQLNLIQKNKNGLDKNTSLTRKLNRDIINLENQINDNADEIKIDDTNIIESINVEDEFIDNKINKVEKRLKKLLQQVRNSENRKTTDRELRSLSEKQVRDYLNGINMLRIRQEGIKKLDSLEKDDIQSDLIENVSKLQSKTADLENQLSKRQFRKAA